MAGSPIGFLPNVSRHQFLITLCQRAVDMKMFPAIARREIIPIDIKLRVMIDIGSRRQCVGESLVTVVHHVDD